MIPGFDKEGFDKNIDLLRQIAEKSQAAVGKWDTPLPGQRGAGSRGRGRAARRKQLLAEGYTKKAGVWTKKDGDRVTKLVTSAADKYDRRASKRMAYKAMGFRKVNGKWVRPKDAPKVGQ